MHAMHVLMHDACMHVSLGMKPRQHALTWIAPRTARPEL